MGSLPVVRENLLIVMLGAVGVALISWLAVYAAPSLPIAVITAVPAVLIGLRLGLWRSAVTVSFAASVLRSSDALPEMGDALWYPVQFGPILAAAAALFFFSSKPEDQRSVDRWIVYGLAGFVVVAAAGSVTTGSVTSQQQVALLVLMSVFLGLTFTRRWSDDRHKLYGDMALLFALISIAQVVGLAANAAGLEWATDPDYGRFRGLFSNANYAGVLSAIALPLAVRFWVSTRGSARLAVATATTALVGAMLLSGSRGAILAAVVGFLVASYSPLARRFLGWAAAVAGVGALIAWLANPGALAPLTEFFGRDTNGVDITSGRTEIYGELLDRWGLNPLLGTGYRTTEELSAVGSQTGLAGHNIYLSVLAETGLIGAVVFLLLLAFIFRAGTGQAATRAIAGAAVAVAVVELTESSIYGWGGPTALMAWLVLLGYSASARFPADAPQTAAAVSDPPLATVTR